MTKDNLLTGRFVLITTGGFVYFLALGMLIPALPHYVEDELGGGSLAVGIVVGSFGITAAFLRPAVGRLGDRRGRRILVIGGALLVGLSLVGYAFSRSIPVLIGFRLLTGVGEAAVFVGAATAAQDLAPDHRRAEAASYFSVAVYGGEGLGPLIAEELRTSVGFGAVWATAIGLCLLTALLGRGVPVGTLAHGPSARRHGLLHPAAVPPATVLLLSLVGFGGFSAFVALHLEDLGTDNAGPVFLLFSAVVLVLRLGGARLADRHAPRTVAGVGLALIASGLALIAAWPSPAGVYAGTLVLAPGVALQYPALMAICMASVPAEERTSAMATMSLPFDLSYSVALPVLGGIAALTGYRGVFVTGAVTAVVAVVVLRRMVAAIPAPTMRP